MADRKYTEDHEWIEVDGETGTGRSFHSPAYSMVPRRGGTLHPQHKFNMHLYEEIRESAKAW